MTVNIFLNTVALLLVALAPNICAGCTDESTVRINSDDYTCSSALAAFGTDTICNHASLSQWCCASCAKASGGSCQDQSSVSINSKTYTCSSALAAFGTDTICDHKTLSPMCCASCAKASEASCEDESTFSINSESITCPAALVTYGVDTICEHPTLSASCCESCAPIKEGRCVDQKSVTVNSETYTCASAFEAYGVNTICNHEDLSQICCDSCAPILEGGCKDYNSLSINGQTHNCYSAFDVYGITTICEHEDLRPQCCASCEPVSIINKKMTAEGFFILDRKSLDIFLREANNDEKKAAKQVVEDAILAVNEVNTLYDSLLEYGLDITISIADIQVLDTDIVSGTEIMDGDVVDKDVIYNKLSDWLQTSAAALSDTKYDFAMLLSGYDIEDPTRGYAAMARMCQRGKAVGVIEFRALPDDTHTLAHEIGHVLGASHDPEGYKTVMAAESGADRTLDKYKFSDQSAKNITDYLSTASLASGCLFDSATSSELPSVTLFNYNGNSQDPYYVCERQVGVGSTPCLADYFYFYGYNSEGVCRELFCRDSDPTRGCWPANPPEGMACGPGKSCQRGICADDPRLELDDVSATCPLGEDVMPTDQVGVTCDSLLGTDASWYCRYYGEICCESCAKFKTDIEGCEYGDVMDFNVGSVAYSDCNKAIEVYGVTEICERNNDLKSWCCKTCYERNA